MFSCSEDLETLLLRVTQELRVYSTTKGEKQINETLLRGVTKKLYFNPGLSSASTGWAPSQPSEDNNYGFPLRLGRAGVDFPIFSRENIPQTSFSCEDKSDGG